MKKLTVASLLAIPLLFAISSKAQAQHQFPFPNMGCGGFCMGLFGKIHQHGPLFNYGPYQGYYPFEPYGPWTSDLRYNPPQNNCANGNCGGSGCSSCGSRAGWGRYALTTLTNVFHRVHPLAHRHKQSACSSPSGCGSSEAISTTVAPATETITPAPLSQPAPKVMPTENTGAAGVLTGRVK